MANARLLRAETGKKSNYQPELDIKSSELLLCVDNLDRVMGMRHITSSKTTSSGMGESLYIVHEEKKPCPNTDSASCTHLEDHVSLGV